MAYSAFYLAKFSTLILGAIRQTLTTVFQDDFVYRDDGDNFDEVVAMVSYKPWTRPEISTIALCERIVRLLHHAKISAGAQHAGPSPSIIAFALCLLVRYRLTGKRLDVTRGSLIAISVYIAYKFLNDEGATKLLDWARGLDWFGPKWQELERNFLAALGHNVWTRNSVYEQYVGRMEQIWAEALEKEIMPRQKLHLYAYQTALR